MSQVIETIRPETRWSFLKLKEVWAYRELLWTFVERDIRVRYKQTVVGVSWAIVQPFVTMVLFSFFFGKLANMPSNDVPYPVFSYVGLVLWTYVSDGVKQANGSLVGNARLLSKVYFPRILIPMASVLTGLVDYIVASLIIFGLMWWYGMAIPWTLIFLPFLLFFSWMLSSGIGFFLSATNVIFRDVGYVVKFLLQIWIYMTPVIYPLSVAGRFRWLVILNPMSGIIEAHRALWLPDYAFAAGAFAYSVMASVVLFVGGLYYFHRIERSFADVI